MPISPAADNPPNSTLPPPAKIFPPSKSTLPPTRVMLSPVATSKPLPLLATDRLTISPGLSRKFKPMGIPIVNNGGRLEFTALNSNPFSNSKLSAVEPKNEPRTSNLAFGPKTIPLGLMKNRLAFPKTPRVPRMLEGLFPVTRLKILAIPLGLAK